MSIEPYRLVLKVKKQKNIKLSLKTNTSIEFSVVSHKNMTTNQVGYLPQFYVSAKRFEGRICPGEKKLYLRINVFFSGETIMYDLTNIGPDSNEIPSVNSVKITKETLKIGPK